MVNHPTENFLGEYSRYGASGSKWDLLTARKEFGNGWSDEFDLQHIRLLMKKILLINIKYLCEFEFHI